MGRIALAVIGGYFLMGILVVATDQLFALAGMQMASPPPAYFAAVMLTSTLYTVIGGYYCAAIAASGGRPGHAGKARWALIAVGEAAGIAGQTMLWNSVPHWYAIGLLILYPIAVWFGAGLRMRKEPAAEQA